MDRNNIINKTYCFDIDGTICTDGVEYKDAKPFPKVVDRINKLYDKGNTIIVSTSRGSRSGKDWFEFTEKQLNEWGIKYHELQVGKKPPAHIFVDDRSTTKMKHVMAVGAHPDDIEFGCSGTLIKHHNNGDLVVYVCMTSTPSVDATTGETIRSGVELTNEVECATKTLGIDVVEFLQFKDLHVPFSFESVSSLEKLIKKYKIDTIYTHWAGDSNQDHIATFKTTMAAARYVPNVFCYEQIPIPRHTENPMSINYYSDITDTFNTKIKASECHKSQYKKYKAAGFDVSKNLKIMAQHRGIEANCEYAEGFNVIKRVEK